MAMSFQARIAVLSAAASIALAMTAPAHACSVPKELLQFSLPLPHLAASVHKRLPIKIVALGSSSTAGQGASNPSMSYPARLQQQLRKAWPDMNVQVVNAGINGQLAGDMTKRLDHDVLALRPQLVIWQTGVNDAIRGLPLNEFKRTLADGIDRLRARGADVVLVDQQYYPRYEKLKDGPAYLAAMRDVARDKRVPLVQRFRMMKYLVDSHQFSVATMLSGDQFHLNDRSYECFGKLLSEQLRGAVSAQPVHTGKTL
jgi:acyl-CoA thioesterase-1